MQEERVILTEANIASSCRAHNKPGEYMLLPMSNRVGHVLPYFEGVDVQVLATPELGAEFVQHELLVNPNGGTKGTLNQELEQFLYVLEGELTFELDGKKHHLVEGGFSWLPPNTPYSLANPSEALTRLTWIRRHYEKVDGIPIPDAMSFEQAACISEVYITAFLNLFLIESGLLGLIGGMIGTLFGVVLSIIAGKFIEQALSAPFSPSFRPALIIGAVAFSFFLGAISGTLPARQASKLQPVEALRYE